MKEVEEEGERVGLLLVYYWKGIDINFYIRSARVE